MRFTFESIVIYSAKAGDAISYPLQPKAPINVEI